MRSSDDLDCRAISRSQAIPHDVKKAVDLIRRNVGRRISLRDLVAHCGIPERTLRKHFHAFMGVSPLEFWRTSRLAAVREDLLKGANDSSITDVATRFGFTHFGRFSQQYRRRFGETPSATLQRSRVARHQPIGRSREEGPGVAGGVAVGARSSREKPSIAILPCQVSAAEPDCGSFADYLTEGMAIALCRARSLSVVFPRPTQNVRSLDPKRLSRQLGARYFISSRIAQTGRRVRIIVNLIDAATSVHLWGDTYDGEIGDLFGLQDRVTESLMRAILPQIRSSEIDRAQRKRPQDLDAHGLTMRAFPLVFATYPDAARQALDLLDRAIAIDPDYALASAFAAYCHAQLVLYNGTASPNQERALALLLSDRAGILDQDDPAVLTARCAVHTMAGQLDHAGALIARVLALDPTFVWGWERSGWVHAYLGEPDAAIKHFKEAIRLDPRPPNATRLIGIGCAHFDAGRYERAALWKQKALREHPSTAWINRTLSVSYARLGERLAALDSLNALRRYAPDLTIEKIVASIPFAQDFLDRVAEGLDDLGVPA